MARKVHKTIPQSEIRRIFNGEGYLDQVNSGELTALITYSKHRSPPEVWLPVCTHSQRVTYYDSDGDKIVEVHRYLQPDLTLGASGLPDPKELFHNGIVYHADIV